MSRTAIAITFALLLVAGAAVAPMASAHAATITPARADSPDTLSQPPAGSVIVWGRTLPALRYAMAAAVAYGLRPVGYIQYGYVRDAGGYVWWVEIV